MSETCEGCKSQKGKVDRDGDVWCKIDGKCVITLDTEGVYRLRSAVGCDDYAPADTPILPDGQCCGVCGRWYEDDEGFGRCMWHGHAIDGDERAECPHFTAKPAEEGKTCGTCPAPEQCGNMANFDPDKPACAERCEAETPASQTCVDCEHCPELSDEKDNRCGVGEWCIETDGMRPGCTKPCKHFTTKTPPKTDEEELPAPEWKNGAWVCGKCERGYDTIIEAADCNDSHETLTEKPKYKPYVTADFSKMGISVAEAGAAFKTLADTIGKHTETPTGKDAIMTDTMTTEEKHPLIDYTRKLRCPACGRRKWVHLTTYRTGESDVIPAPHMKMQCTKCNAVIRMKWKASSLAAGGQSTSRARRAAWWLVKWSARHYVLSAGLGFLGWQTAQSPDKVVRIALAIRDFWNILGS